ncbi:hypothetical protein Theco_1150 [Thermobacillus composti KWC4]|uniref:GT-D fold-like domain-containing protein n=1 Tax=Thermobacillus composti (strain DSM 18247 / JCM 13945 / KWC4) TaxID=717605 RepID=L0EC19_THECK|nr:GT-D fold domain-containing glycosyltransferase [Thermobacillus composti]AGA57322.1 hypothetical protein Theco_1150 [Thermobacillus composti KWC4]
MNGVVLPEAPAVPEARPVRRVRGPRRKARGTGVVRVRRRKRTAGALRRRGAAAGAAVGRRKGGRRRYRIGGKRPAVLQRRRLPAGTEGTEAGRERTEAGRSAASIEEALERGRYEGGELLLEQAVPAGFTLGDLTLQDVIAAGVDALRPRLLPLIDAAGVFHEFEAALAEGRTLSVVRLGDGELLALSHDRVYEAAVVRGEAPFLAGAGMAVPDHAARDRLAAAVRQASIVGVPLSRRRHYGPLLGPALAGNGIDIRSLRLTESTINYSLYQTGLLARLMQGRRLLVIGNAAPGMAARLAAAGYAVTGVISPVRGFADIDRVIGEAAAARDSYDLALVAAGIPAVVIAAALAAEFGKAALDFGHLADHIAARPPGEI